MKLIIPVDIFCPRCGVRHVDTDKWEKQAHTTHKCLSCDWEFDAYVTGAPEPDHPEPDICCKCLIVFKSGSEVYTDGDGNKHCSGCMPVDQRIKISTPESVGGIKQCQSCNSGTYNSIGICTMCMRRDNG